MPGVTGGEPAAREQETIELGEARTGLPDEHARLLVEAEDAVRESRRDDLVRGVARKRRVAVRATEAAAERGAFRRGLELLGQELPTRCGNATPATELGMIGHGTRV